MPEYSIVIPVYNESPVITSSLTQVLNFMKTFSGNFEIIVVDDGSTDKTVEAVEKYISNDEPGVKLLKLPHRGKGPTVTSGVKEARGLYIYLADADFATNISELKKLSVWMREQDYDIVIASREGFGAQRIGEPLYRHLMGRIFNYWVQLVALYGINDSQCGFKLFKNSVAKDIFSRLKIYGDSQKELTKPYFGALDVEALFIARKLKYRIKEVPVTWVYVKTTRLRIIHNSFQMAWDVFRVRLNDIMGKYKSAHSLKI